MSAAEMPVHRADITGRTPTATRHESALKVWYVLMAFPVPSETFVATDVRALSRLGVEVSVHTFRGPRSDAVRLLEERGLSDLRISHGTLPNIVRGIAAALRRPLVTAQGLLWAVRYSGGRVAHLAKALALLPRAVGLLEDIERERPDVVHLYWGHYPAILGWLVLEHAPGVIVSLSLSAYDLLREYPGSAAVARRAHLVSTWARANVAAVARCGVAASRVYVSWQGVDLQKISAHVSDKIPRRVVTAGRLVAEKGMDDVLRAFANVASEHPNASLVVLGDGPARPRLEKLACELGIGHAVVFRGHVPHDRVFAELARAEVFLFLSRYRAERLPNVVKEAMASRCCVIATATPGLDELIEDGVDGRSVPEGDWKQAAAYTLDAFADPNAAARMAAAAQDRVVGEFDALELMRRMVRKWEECGTAPAGRVQTITASECQLAK